MKQNSTALLYQLLVCISLFPLALSAQQPILQAGSPFPDLLIRNISNAPVKEINLNQTQDKKLYLLNFWGTWCSPCIPEMDALAKLQKANSSKLQIIAISDDSPEKKQKYAAKKPSGIWLATDTTYTLYDMLGLASVGHCAVVNTKRQVVAVLRSDSINQQTIDRLLNGTILPSNAYIKDAPANTKEDAFGVDSLQQRSLTIRGYMTGQRTMGKRYLDGPFKDRRVSWFNVPITTIYRAAYNINTPKQEVYDSSVSKKALNDFDNRKALYCVDFLVEATQTDSLLPLLQAALNSSLPVKVRKEERVMPVYLLKRRTDTTVSFSPSKAAASSYSFSGKGFDGKKITLAAFADHYLTNEMSLPVVDETGLTGAYDIKTSVELSTTESVTQSIHIIGIVLEKSERKMPVLVYYR